MRPFCWSVTYSRSQGLLGVFGLSGVEDFRRDREKQKKKKKERWADMGRLAGRQAAGESLFFFRFLNQKQKQES